jgi:hypothetical protein
MRDWLLHLSARRHILSPVTTCHSLTAANAGLPLSDRGPLAYTPTAAFFPHGRVRNLAMGQDAPAPVRNPVRAFTDRLRRRGQPGELPPGHPLAGRPANGPPLTILDRYCTGAPDPQTALDIFTGEWASMLPGDWRRYRAGAIPLFGDRRIAWGLKQLGGVVGQSVLELGPLEGGHSWMLEQAGATSVTAIEANTRAYLKCLVVKELLGLQRTRFLCGDFVEYLRQSPPRYDFVLASGVLYHMTGPAELIGLVSQVTDRVLIWTHYYDERIIAATPRLAPRFPRWTESEYRGFRHRLYRQEYAEAVDFPNFCGGSAPASHWLSRQDILDCLRYFGFDDQVVALEEPEHLHGPCFLIAARRTKPAA